MVTSSAKISPQMSNELRLCSCKKQLSQIHTWDRCQSSCFRFENIFPIWTCFGSHSDSEASVELWRLLRGQVTCSSTWSTSRATNHRAARGGGGGVGGGGGGGGEAQVEPEAEKSVFGECTCKRSSPGERLLVKRSPLLLPRSASPACKEIISGFQSSSSYNCRSKSLARTPDQLDRPPLLHKKSRRHSGTLSCATRSWESFFLLASSSGTIHKQTSSENMLQQRRPFFHFICVIVTCVISCDTKSNQMLFILDYRLPTTPSIDL